MNTVSLWIAALLFLAIASVVLVLFGRRFLRPKLSAASRARIQKSLRDASGLEDPVRRVLQMDSILDHALRELGYKGSLGEKLKTMGARFSQIDDVWRAHKLRNRYAHEPHATVNASEAQRACAILRRAVEELL